MSKKPSSDIVVREKRQVTLPRAICEQLGIVEGDRLTVYVEGDRLVGKPSKNVAVDALSELHRIFKNAEISEKELQQTSRRIRRELVKKHYGTSR